MLIVGEKEKESQTVSLRRRHEGDLGTINIDELVSDLSEEIKIRRRH
jgi:threonyl-tRNA synthetase